MADAPEWNEGLTATSTRYRMVRDRRREHGARRDDVFARGRRAAAHQLARRAPGRAAPRRGPGVGHARDRVRRRTCAAGRDLRRRSSRRYRSGGCAAPVPRARLRRGVDGRRVTDGTPREQLVWDDIVLRGDGIFLRPLRQADADRGTTPARTTQQLRGFEFPGPASLARGRSRDRRVALVVGGERTGPQFRHLERGDRWARRQRRGARAGRQRRSTSRTSCSPSGDDAAWRRARRGSCSSTAARSWARAGRASRRSQTTRHRLGVVRGLGARSTGAVQRPTGSRYLTFSLEL